MKKISSLILISLFFLLSINIVSAASTAIVRVTGTTTNISGFCMGDLADCSKPMPVKALCDKTLVNVCTYGTFEDSPDTDTNYLWRCAGQNGGEAADCSLPKPVDGVCNNTIVNTCTAGTFMDVADSVNRYNWACNSTTGGYNTLCSSDSTMAYLTYLSLKYAKTVGIIMLLLGFVLVSLVFLRKSKNKKFLSLLILLFVSSVMFVGPGEAKAETAYWYWNDSCQPGWGCVTPMPEPKTISGLAPNTSVCLTRLPYTATGRSWFSAFKANGQIYSGTACFTVAGGSVTFELWPPGYFASTRSCGSGGNVICAQTNLGTLYPGIITYTASTNGACGTTPHTCSSGTLNNVADIDNQYIWSCVGNGGSSVSCSASRNTKVDGRCNNAVQNVCTAGTFSDQPDDTYYRWNCNGTGGGSNDSCFKAKPVNASCGASLNSCTSGSFSDASDSSTDYIWNCQSGGEGSNAVCYKPKSIAGVCNNAVQNVCTSGTFSDVADTETEYFWNCIGTAGGGTASCSLPRIIRDPSCSVTPHTCLAGVYMDLPDTATDYMWLCNNSIPGGINAFCTQPIPVNVVNGACGANENTCNSGTLNNIQDSSTQYLWNCAGSNGGFTDQCAKPKTINGDCNNEQNNACFSGNSVNLDDTATEYKWKCVGQGGGNTDQCSMTIPLVLTNGSCGATNNSCLGGTFADVADTATHYKWNCTGLNGGTTANCTMLIPVNPVNAICGATKDTCTSGDFSDLADTETNYRWNCNSTTGGINRTCNLSIPITCTLEMNPRLDPVNINTNTTWEANPPRTCLGCTPSWTIVDDNGTTNPVSASPLNKTFTTIGLKTVSATFSTTTITGVTNTYTCAASTTAVLSGGVIIER